MMRSGHRETEPDSQNSERQTRNSHSPPSSLLADKFRGDVFEFRYGSNIGQGSDHVAVARYERVRLQVPDHQTMEPGGIDPGPGQFSSPGCCGGLGFSPSLQVSLDLRFGRVQRWQRDIAEGRTM